MVGMLDGDDGWRRFYGGLLLVRRRGVYEASVLSRLRRVRQSVSLRPEVPVDLEEMARTAAFSKYHFLRLFRDAYGETPGRYLSRLRLERARLLLETTDQSVTDICLEVGYESPASFSSAFRKFSGVPPQRYRRQWVAVPGPIGRPLRLPGCFLAMYG
jgi:transcriptional regulator GlxA family with amidase domain